MLSASPPHSRDHGNESQGTERKQRRGSQDRKQAQDSRGQQENRTQPKRPKTRRKDACMHMHTKQGKKQEQDTTPRNQGHSERRSTQGHPRPPRRSSRVWHMYDSSTSRFPTASHRRGPRRDHEEGILRQVPLRSKTPRPLLLCGPVWPTRPTESLPLLCVPRQRIPRRKDRREFRPGTRIQKRQPPQQAPLCGSDI